MLTSYTLTFNAQAVDTIAIALGKLPLEQSIDLFLELKRQVVAAQAAVATSEKSKPEETKTTLLPNYMEEIYNADPHVVKALLEKFTSKRGRDCLQESKPEESAQLDLPLDAPVA